MVKQTKPFGFTKPGYKPVVRLGPQGALLAQNHEALHHHFNTLTTLGNSLALLGQISERCSAPLGDIAMKIGSKWSEAAVNKAEGVTHYVAYKRTERRIPNLSIDSVENILTEMDVSAWRDWRNKYDDLDLEPGSKDALAMHVATHVFNIPLYEKLEDLAFLDDKVNLITKKILDTRFLEVESALFSEDGLSLLQDWDEKMEALWATDKTAECKSREESSSFDAIFRELMPEFESAPRANVPDSVELASNWNAQLENIGMSASCRVSITYNGYIHAINDVLIIPPAPSLNKIDHFSDPSVVVDILKANPDVFSLGIAQILNDKDYVFSHKYKRTLSRGDVYIRFSFAKPTENMDRYNIAGNHISTILSVEELTRKMTFLNHSNLVITQSEPSDEILDKITSSYGGKPEQAWRFRWGLTGAQAHDSIMEVSANVSSIQSVEMHNSNSVFWIVKMKDQNWLDVYPVTWNTRNTFSSLIEDIPNVTPLKLKPAMVFCILGLIINVGY